MSAPCECVDRYEAELASLRAALAKAEGRVRELEELAVALADALSREDLLHAWGPRHPAAYAKMRAVMSPADVERVLTPPAPAEPLPPRAT